MSNTEKRNLKIRKLYFSRETLRTLSGEQLMEVAGGRTGGPTTTSRYCGSVSCPTR